MPYAQPFPSSIGGADQHLAKTLQEPVTFNLASKFTLHQRSRASNVPCIDRKMPRRETGAPCIRTRSLRFQQAKPTLRYDVALIPSLGERIRASHRFPATTSGDPNLSARKSVHSSSIVERNIHVPGASVRRTRRFLCRFQSPYSVRTLSPRTGSVNSSGTKHAAISIDPHASASRRNFQSFFCNRRCGMVPFRNTS